MVMGEIDVRGVAKNVGFKSSLGAFAWTVYERANRRRYLNNGHRKLAHVFVLFGVSSVKGVLPEIRRGLVRSPARQALTMCARICDRGRLLVVF